MKFSKILTSLFMICLVFSLIIFGYYYQRYTTLKQENIQQSAKEALFQLAYSEREYRSLRSQMVSIANLLSHSQSIYDYLIAPTNANKRTLEEVWSSIAVNQKWYTSVRFIDTKGMEKIKVNYSVARNIATPEVMLEDISHRDYFKHALTLADREIGSWGIDLEQDLGEFVIPYTPTLRVMIPVTMMGRRAGYLIINLDVWYLSSRLNYSPNNDFRPEVINEEGFYIASHHGGKLFGDLIERRRDFNIAKQFPDAWLTMNNKKVGYVVEDDTLVAFTKLKLSESQSLRLIIQVSQQQLKQRAARDVNDLYQEAIFVFLLMLLFAVPTTSMLLHYHKRNIESKLARAALNGMSAVMISDKSHRVVMVNEEFCNMTGYRPNQVTNRNLLKILLGERKIEKLIDVLDIVSQRRRWEGELRIKNASGGEFTVITRIQAVLSANIKVDYYITSFVDISARKELEERLRTLSEKDELTGLWNRRKFESELVKSAQLVERYGAEQAMCLALVDIDHFKRVNDEKGHDEGDRVIRVVGHTLAETLRNTDFIARIGGEEFAIIMPHTSVQEAALVLNRIRQAVEKHSDLTVTVSAGFTDLTSNSNRSYKWADIALYESKDLGRNLVSLRLSKEEIV
ncbi:sensor domain-containing diguanylate cyclase [Vibrio paucivorans]|uniref:diguanylate cyclase n=1 Tax=Vibrio paucivorans TaxID=2829489 RepID=A0A9X3CB57_9VIBR|nr:sensor domain-containing diguanylate cyclase [Vibrio paucivorans]MCW8332483.1 diguanylate cyclase [Vibrio paucivorans]